MLNTKSLKIDINKSFDLWLDINSIKKFEMFFSICSFPHCIPLDQWVKIQTKKKDRAIQPKIKFQCFSWKKKQQSVMWNGIVKVRMSFYFLQNYAIKRFFSIDFTKVVLKGTDKMKWMKFNKKWYNKPISSFKYIRTHT